MQRSSPGPLGGVCGWVCRTSFFKCCAYCRVSSPPASLLQQHCNMPLSIPLRFARSFSLARMRPTVPSIDLQPFLYGSAGDRQRIASEIDEALGSVGFIQLHNHGIEQHKVDACFQWVSRITHSYNTSAPVALNADSTANCRANVFSPFQSPGRGQSVHLLHHIIAGTRV